ncbi:hypothetical protein ACSQ67_003672 [Phaseolus vulgaris]
MKYCGYCREKSKPCGYAGGCDAAPEVAPPVNKKMGRPAKGTQQDGRACAIRDTTTAVNVGTESQHSNKCPSRVNYGRWEFGFGRANKKSMVETLELQSRALVTGRTPVKELERTIVVVIPKLKKEPKESSRSFKTALATNEQMKTKMEEERLSTAKVQEVMKADLDAQVKRVADRKKSPEVEVRKC